MSLSSHKCALNLRFERAVHKDGVRSLTSSFCPKCITRKSGCKTRRLTQHTARRKQAGSAADSNSTSHTLRIKTSMIMLTTMLTLQRSGKIMRRILRKIASGELDALGESPCQIFSTLLTRLPFFYHFGYSHLSPLCQRGISRLSMRIPHDHTQTLRRWSSTRVM